MAVVIAQGDLRAFHERVNLPRGGSVTETGVWWGHDGLRWHTSDAQEARIETISNKDLHN